MRIRSFVSAAGGGGAATAIALAVVLASSASAAAMTSTSSQVAPHLTESRILRIAITAAAGAGDPTPTLIQHSEGTRAKANLITSGAVVGGDERSYLIVERGHFVANNAPRPPGAHAPSGSVLTLIVDASTGDVTDFGIHDRYPDLVALGPVTTDLRAAPASGSVRLGITPTVARPGAKIRLVIVNDSPHTIDWGGCFVWQRWVGGQWQPDLLGHCLALFIFRPHSRTSRVGPLGGDHPPGRYRIAFQYQDAPATARQPELVAYAYLTVAPPAIRKGTLTGEIIYVGGDPLANHHRSVGGVVTVFDLQGKVVAHAQVRAGHRFRFELSPGEYQLIVGRELHPPVIRVDCPSEMVQVRASRTTHVNVNTGCLVY